MTIQTYLQAFTEELIPTQVLFNLLKEYKRPYDKIADLVKKGELIQVKNGLYIPGLMLNISRPENFLIANHLWGPSYISLESALSYWGYIPERVYETISVTPKRSRQYKTPVGRFSYRHAPLPYFSFGIQRVELTPKQAVLIASPEKAVCDKIALTSGLRLRNVTQARTFLTEDLRIDEDNLSKLNTKTLSTWLADAPKTESLAVLIKTLETL